MTKISIPPAALEKGCGAYTAVIYRGNGTQAEFREAISAAFLAMLEAWPGAEEHNFDGWTYAEGLVLPLTEKPDDKV